MAMVVALRQTEALSKWGIKLLDSGKRTQAGWALPLAVIGYFDVFWQHFGDLFYLKMQLKNNNSPEMSSIWLVYQ